MKHNYCTVYSKSYLYMGLILYNSLLKYDQDFCLYLICMDDEAFSIMENLNPEHIVLINLKDIELEDKELYASKSSRTEKEYSWTIKGSVLLYLLKNFESIDHIIWLDGDLKFFSDPQPIFDKLSEHSLLLTEEKYTGPYDYLSKIYGVYQLGFIGFKRDANSLECLNWYRKRLIEWCHEKPLDGKWSDQMYAVDWPIRFKAVGIVENTGVNLTPFIAYRLQQEGKGLIHEHDGSIYIDNSKIIFFHFYGFKYYDGKEYDLCLHWMKFSDNAVKLLYLDYISDAKEAIERIRSVYPEYYLDSNKKGKYVRNYFNLDTSQMKDIYYFCTTVDSRSIISLLAMYNSLNRYIIRYVLWVCCMDEKSYSFLSSISLPNILLLDSKNIEDDGLRNIKNSCNKEQYRNILKAGISYFLLKNNYFIETLLYLNPTMYFFSHPSTLFESLTEGCVFIYRFMSREEIKKVSEIFSSGLIGFLRKEGALYFLEDFLRGCTNLRYSNFNMPLADYYGIKSIDNLAADMDIFLLRSINRNIGKDKTFCLKKDLICINFKDSKVLRMLGRILEKRKSTLAKNQAIKQIYKTYIRSLREAYEKIKSF